MPENGRQSYGGLPCVTEVLSSLPPDNATKLGMRCVDQNATRKNHF